MDIPNVQTIKFSAFSSCKNLFVVELPSIIYLLGNTAKKNNIFTSCTNLVSLTLGPNLKEISGEVVVNNTAFRELNIEVDDYSNIKMNDSFFTTANINPGLNIFVEDGTHGKQISQLLPYVKEKGQKVGLCEVTRSDGKTYNLGEYVIRDVSIYNQEGISICAYNFSANDTPTNYKMPNIIDGKKVLRIGYNSYRKFNYDVIDLLDHDENFEIADTLLEIGSSAFEASKIRISNLKNVKYIDYKAFYNCDNIFVINAPNLEYIGESGFQDCSYLVSFRAEKLYEIAKNAFSTLPKAYEIITNIQVMAESSWTQSNNIRLITFAMDDNATLSGYSGTSHRRVVVTNATLAAKYGHGQYTYSKDEVKFVKPYKKDVTDTGGKVIYQIDCYEYMINSIGDEVTIYRCFMMSFDSDHTVPGQLDNRIVTTVGANSYYSINFNENQIKFANSITKIEGNSIQSCNLGGELNTNQVTSIGTQAFSSNGKLKSLVGPKLTTIGDRAFLNCNELISVNLPSFTTTKNASFYDCTSVKLIYLENLFTFATNTFHTKSGLTFIINNEVTSSDDIPLTNWHLFSNITIYVPYNSVQYYKEAFIDNATYVNFKILPYGTFASVENEETGIADQFILKEIEYGYDFETDSYLKGYEVVNIISINYNVVIPYEWTYEGVTLPIVSISEKALEGQICILNLTLPKYLLAYDEFTFQGGKNLQNIFVDEDNKYFASDNGILYTKDYSELICCPKAHKSEVYTIREETIAIRSYAFKDCLNLCDLVANVNLKYIGANAFEGTFLRTIEFKTEKAPIVSGENVFDPNNNGLIIYVPATAINNYKNVMAFRYYKILIKNNNQ